MKKAFTLIELLVVIAILGTLVGSMFYIFGSTESARSVECMANMGNLAKAVLNAQMDKSNNPDRRFPLAGSVEGMEIRIHTKQNSRNRYMEFPGWISWNSRGAYKNNPSSHVSNQGWFLSTYNQDEEARNYCLTNGTLYSYVKNYSTYLCPGHLKKMPESQRPTWSYVMNGYFGYDKSKGAGTTATDVSPARKEITSPSERLLFAELQWEEYVDYKPNFNSGSGIENDCTLQYADNEIIGFNHKDGNDIVAHVAFADGRVDKIRLPEGGLSEGELKRLTEYLCTAQAYEIKGAGVSKVK